jgi:thiol-disulfide isomerase/thioredoxin
MKIRIVAFLAFISLFVAGSPLGAGAATDTSLRPVLAAPEGWLNGSASAKNVEGKVVVVDVFTFGCGNCQNVVPNLRKLAAKHDDGLVIIGVHSPETAYERTRSNVVDNLRSQGITWPVALDNSFGIWHAYGVDAWPTQMIFDKHGRLRKTIVGDSQDAELNASIDALLAEN